MSLSGLCVYRSHPEVGLVREVARTAHARSRVSGRAAASSPGSANASRHPRQVQTTPANDSRHSMQTPAASGERSARGWNHHPEVRGHPRSYMSENGNIQFLVHGREIGAPIFTMTRRAKSVLQQPLRVQIYPHPEVTRTPHARSHVFGRAVVSSPGSANASPPPTARAALLQTTPAARTA